MMGFNMPLYDVLVVSTFEKIKQFYLTISYLFLDSAVTSFNLLKLIQTYGCLILAIQLVLGLHRSSHSMEIVYIYQYHLY